MSYGSVTELLYASTSPGIAKNTFTTEITINDTVNMGVQYHLPPDFWLPNNVQVGRGIKIVGKGMLASTGTPTYIPIIRFGASGSTSGPTIGSPTTALTTISGANNFFEIELDVVMKSIGPAGANSTVQSVGRIMSSGLAVPISPLWGNAALPGTVPTVDTSIANYINVNFICSVSNAANQVQLFQLLVFGLN